MARTGYLNRQVYGDAVLERLARSPHVGVLRKELQGFKAEQSGYCKACAKVASAQGKRDEVMIDIGEADGGLDNALQRLADRLVGAGLGKRQNPFADYSRHSPQKLTELGYVAEEKETRALIAKLRKKKLPAEVAAAVKAVSEAADNVAKVLEGLTGPQAEYEAAMQARDGLLLSWNKALGRLKRAAAVAHDEDRAGYRSLFAPAQGLQTTKRRPRKKTPAPPPPPTTPPSS